MQAFCRLPLADADARDDKFIDLALNGQARAIVTDDQDLLVLHPLHGVGILTPAQFLAL